MENEKKNIIVYRCTEAYIISRFKIYNLRARKKKKKMISVLKPTAFHEISIVPILCTHTCLCKTNMGAFEE